MFALVVTIISIALVGLVALAVIYYGGDVMNQSGGQASVSRYLSEGVQVQGALELYRVEHGVLPTGTAEQIKQQLLVGGFLKTWPAGEWTLVNDYAVRTDLSQATCEAVNKKMNVNIVPVCGDPLYSNRNLCCTTL